MQVKFSISQEPVNLFTTIKMIDEAHILFSYKFVNFNENFVIFSTTIFKLAVKNLINSINFLITIF